uniref:AMP-dependent synthetase/ligase domain-containing protein n=1 Tax=Anopheles farauti TaxID=69004 RepID=A0A182QIE9_9DIPT
MQWAEAVRHLKTVYDTNTQTWHSPSVKLLFNPEASLGQVMLEILLRSPDRVMQRDMDTGRSMTYAEFRTRLVRFAQNLTANGVRQGDVVTLANANSENLAPLACALLTIGAPMNPLAPSFNEDDMANMLRTTKPKLVFCDDNNYEVVRNALEKVVTDKDQMPPLYVLESDREDVKHAEDLLKETGQEENFAAPYLGDSHKTLAGILCSSGSSGVHKGVRMTHAVCVHKTTMFRFSSVPTVEFTFSSLYWTTGFTFLLGPFFSGGIRLFTRNAFNEDDLFTAIEKHRATVIFTPPASVSAMLAHPKTKSADFSSVRFWITGGSYVPEGLRDRMDALLAPTGGRLLNGIGPTETGLIAIDLVRRKPNAIGPLMPNIMVRIVDESGTRLGVGEPGELLVKSVEGFGGYYENEEATAQAIDADGFFRTGDVAYIDEDSYLYVVDRQKDIFKYRNYQISPNDLEAIISRIEGVKSVCVVGIPDAESATDVPAAAIVRTGDASALEAAQVRTIVDAQVSDFKRLRGGVYFVEELPKTHSGKILRRKVTEMIRAMNQHQQASETNGLDKC